MTSAKLQDKLFSGILAICVVIVVVLPFHAFITVWVASIFGHYTAFRLWKELLLACAAIMAAAILLLNAPIRRRLYRDWLFCLIGLYAALVVLAGLCAYHSSGVNRTALLDGILLDLRFLLFFVVAWLVSQKRDFLHTYWRQLLFLPAAVVVAVGLLQRFVLPYDFLRHFGYDSNTISPYETIDHKKAYLRIQSTLRGANPLGAYLVMIVAALAVYGRQIFARWWRWLLAVGSALALVLTYSRSAWIGAVVSLAVVVFMQTATNKRIQKIVLLVVAGGVLILAGTMVILRHNDYVQNTFFHTDEHSTSATSSNTGHVAALKNGARDMIHHPLGSGTGTAGPASQHNLRPARIAENYYIQIGQETGFIGLGLFVAINVIVAIRLWRRREDALARMLLASLAGITIVNVLSHAWTDDTLSYIWWGLAGAALAYPKKSKANSAL